MALKLHTIICSTRPGRQAPAVARWFHEAAQVHGRFDCVLVDLADFGLPLLDESRHPRLKQYEKEHTKRWSASVASADAFAFVTPEYNHFVPPSLVNALDFLVAEWNHKPAGLVTFGGVSGGLRAAQSVKPLLAALKMMPLLEAVSVPMFAQHIGEDGVFRPNEPVTQSVAPMLDELFRWAEVLKPLRAA